jgi:formylglycine-generating enzyme required for sulfatase activity
MMRWYGIYQCAVLAALAVGAGAAQPAAAEQMLAIGDAGFRLDAHEVTNRQMAAFLNEMGNPRVRGVALVVIGSSHALLEEVDGIFRAKGGFAEHPVIEVSFQGARAYCEWAGKRLPTESEWHRACVGLEVFTYPWGNDFDPAVAESGKWANILGAADGFARTAPVGSFPAGRSPYGVWDMGGNVWEWTVGPEGKPILRGGSWSNSYLFARCIKRDDPNASHSFYKSSSVGFSCAKDGR